MKCDAATEQKLTLTLYTRVKLPNKEILRNQRNIFNYHAKNLLTFCNIAALIL